MISYQLVVEQFVFFFSSRRRHTRFDCDSSSDVCSSDLADVLPKDAPIAVLSTPSCVLANEGPDSTAIGASFGSTSANTHDGVESRSGSRPLDTLTTNAPRPILARARVMTSLTAWDGAADTTTSAPRTPAARAPTAASADA